MTNKLHVCVFMYVIKTECECVHYARNDIIAACLCVFVTKTTVCQIKHGANFIKTISLRKYLVFHTQYLFIESDFVFALECEVLIEWKRGGGCLFNSSQKFDAILLTITLRLAAVNCQLTDVIYGSTDVFIHVYFDSKHELFIWNQV